MEFVITVDRLRVHARHGVMEQERVVGNDFEVSASARVDVGPDAYERDSLEATLSYAGMVEVIRREMQTPAHLLEHVCWRICRALRDSSPAVGSVTVTVAKLTPPIAGAAMQSCRVTLTL